MAECDLRMSSRCVFGLLLDIQNTVGDEGVIGSVTVSCVDHLRGETAQLDPIGDKAFSPATLRSAPLIAATRLMPAEIYSYRRSGRDYVGASTTTIILVQSLSPPLQHLSMAIVSHCSWCKLIPSTRSWAPNCGLLCIGSSSIFPPRHLEQARSKAPFNYFPTPHLCPKKPARPNDSYSPCSCKPTDCRSHDVMTPLSSPLNPIVRPSTRDGASRLRNCLLQLLTRVRFQL
jgi:hypothetical protein